MILISAQDSPDSGSWDVISSIRRRPGCRVWLREPVVLNIAIRQWIGGVRHQWKSYGLAHFCTSLMSNALCVIQRSPRCLKLQTWALGVPLYDVIEASPESIRHSTTSVCSVTDSAGQKMLRIAILA